MGLSPETISSLSSARNKKIEKNLPPKFLEFRSRYWICFLAIFFSISQWYDSFFYNSKAKIREIRFLAKIKFEELQTENEQLLSSRNTIEFKSRALTWIFKPFFSISQDFFDSEKIQKISNGFWQIALPTFKRTLYPSRRRRKKYIYTPSIIGVIKLPRRTQIRKLRCKLNLYQSFSIVARKKIFLGKWRQHQTLLQPCEFPSWC